MHRGLFIVIEGIDGSGTTTQCDILHRNLIHRGIFAHKTCQPSKAPIGTFIRQIIRTPAQEYPFTWNTMALLFAADRLQHLELEIDPYLQKGITVISDRYDYSSLVYQLTTSDIKKKPHVDLGHMDSYESKKRWIREINRYAKRPDLTFILNVSLASAQKRLLDRRSSQEMYEQEALQKQLVACYQNIDSFFPTDRIQHIDGNQTIENISGEILRSVLKCAKQN